MKTVHILTFLMLLAVCQMQAAIWYVKPAGSDANSGASWAQAFRNIQTAIDAAQAGDEIWVAAGTYYPTTTFGSNPAPYWRTFKIQKDVKIYGGFSGVEILLFQRNLIANETILSGAQDAVLHVVYTSGVSQACVIDGFTITGGNADLGGGTTTSPNSAGGGWYNDAYDTPSSPRIANCKFVNNHAVHTGGAFVNNSAGGGNAHLVFTACRFEGNTAGLLGGAFYSEGDLTAEFTDCVFDQNGGAAQGGAVCHNLTESTSSLTFTNCEFLRQLTDDDGGAISFLGVEGNRTAVFSGCTFKGNIGKLGAAIHLSENFGNTNIQMVNCLLSGNGSVQSPADHLYLIYLQQSNGSATLDMMNCTITGNATYGHIRGLGSNISLTNCISQQNRDATLQNVTANYCNLGNANFNSFGQNNYNQTPGFVNPLSWNDAPTTGGDYSIQACSPDMDKGTTANAPATDLPGNMRPVGGGIDVGAYEFQSLPAICTTCLTGGNIIYVKANATGGNNGKSWTDAFTDLQDALALANICTNVTEIWVAAGTYKPTSGTDRNSSFTMKNNLGIYGGFAGTETMRSQRNWTTQLSILSGNIGTPGNASDNSHNVILNQNNHLNETAILDGFTITDGHAYPTSVQDVIRFSGGGVHNIHSSPAFYNCTFSNNSAHSGGGAVNNEASSSIFINCTFTGNSAFGGAGMYNRNSSLTIRHCIFSNNSATFGGGISEVFSSSSISYCIFSENSAGGGGGMRFTGDGVHGDIAVVNCLFAGNTAEYGGGAFSFDDHQSGAYNFINCTFWGNTAPSGGVIESSVLDDGATFPSLINCIVWGNSSVFRQNTRQLGSLHISQSLIQGTECPQWVTCGTGVIFNQDPLFVDTDNGDFRLLGCSPALNVGSNAVVPAGITTDLDGSPRFFNNGIVDLGAYEFQGLLPVLTAVCQNATLSLGADNTATVSASQLDNGSTGCGTLNLFVNGQPSFTFNCNNLGQNMVTLTVADAFGSTATCSATVWVEDNTSPDISCPGTQTVVLGANCTAALPDYRGIANANDNCGVLTVTQTPAPGTTVSGAGNMTVTLIATDASGNSTQCSFTVTKVDDTPPGITCPATQTLVLGANCTAALPDYTGMASTSDNCGVQGTTQSPAPGTTVSNSGNMTVTLTVTDINGNSTQCSFTVTKVDNTPPSITCPAVHTLVLGANCSAELPDYRSLAATADNCGVQGTTQSPAPGTIVSNAGNMTVTLTVTDINGNSTQCSFTVTKVDNTPPTVQCFNQTITFNGENSIPLNTDDLVDATDNCGVATIELSPAGISCEQLGQTVPVTVTVTDLNSNPATCTSNITVTGLPCGWSQNPNGVNCANGNSIAYNPANGVWTATSANCFYGPGFTSDATAFAQRTLCGDGSITAQVTSINGTALGWAGVVMRESNMAGAKKAQLMTNLSSLSRREFRTTTNGAANPQQFPSQDRYWLRITRAGHQFSMYVSPNGLAWYFVGAQNIPMNSCIQMGLVATNYQQTSTVVATFANVSFSGGSTAVAEGIVHSAESIESPYGFEVYPNPTGGELNVNLAQYFGRAVRVELYSLTGQLLRFVEIEAVQTTVEQLDMSQLENGMYLVKVKSRELPDMTRRVVLQR